MLRLPLHQTAVDGGNIMSKFIPGNQKHLTLEDRIFIQNELNKGTTFKDIARFLCKDPTTISKKVKARRISDRYHKGSFVNKKNFCVHRYHCRKTNACFLLKMAFPFCLFFHFLLIVKLYSIFPKSFFPPSMP